MGVGRINVSDIDAFIEACDARGGIQHPDAASLIADFEIIYSSSVDEALDPFSEAYVAQQLALYSEISGRVLDQSTGEMLNIDVAFHAAGANPYSSGDVNFIARHAKAVLASLLQAELPINASILDMGSGWGLSSEMMAFCGAQVTSVDINPLFVELNRQRSNRLSLPIRSVQSDFENFVTPDRFDMVFFYECLHHAVRPWNVVSHVASLLRDDGAIVCAGEPFNNHWKHWGLRLDPLSVYCIRKFGWFESGWRESFLVEVFKRAGLRLYLVRYLGLDNGTIGVARRLSDARIPPGVTSSSASDEGIADGADAYQELSAILNSRSWRWTAPIRKVLRTLGRGGR